MERLFIGLAGIAVILGIAVLLSSDRRAIRLRIVGAAFALQAGIAVLVLYSSIGKVVLGGMSGGVANLLGYSQKGTEFLFGKMATPEIGGQSFAIAALPVIIFFASLVSILYYLGIMQFVVRWVGGGIEKVIGVSKVESLCAAANIFVGQSESPLVIRPYLAGLTPAQLFTVMTSGMAGVAGTILAAYASMGDPHRLSARGELHGGAGRHPDGEDHHARPRHAARGRTRARRPARRIVGGRTDAASDARRGKAGQSDHGRGPGRADRRASRGRGRRDGAGVRRAGGARERVARRARQHDSAGRR